MDLGLLRAYEQLVCPCREDPSARGQPAGGGGGLGWGFGHCWNNWCIIKLLCQIDSSRHVSLETEATIFTV